jgi:hypothetical protein
MASQPMLTPPERGSAARSSDRGSSAVSGEYQPDSPPPLPTMEPPKGEETPVGAISAASSPARLAEMNLAENSDDLESPPPIWVLQLITFLSAGTTACLLPFFPKYAEMAGIDEQQYGVLAMLGCISSGAGVVVLGHYADKPHIGTPRVLLVAVIVSSFGNSLMYSKTVMGSFLLQALLWSSVAIFLIGRSTLLNTFAVQQVKRYEGQTYGKIMIFGCIGWAVLSPTTGWLVDIFGVGAVFVMFVGTSVAMGILIYVYFLDETVVSNSTAAEAEENVVTVERSDGHQIHMPRLNIPRNDSQSDAETREPTTARSPSFSNRITALDEDPDAAPGSINCFWDLLNKHFGNIFVAFDTRWLMLYLLIVGIAQTPGESFLYLFLLRRPFNPKPTETILGLAAAIMSLSQIPVWFYAHKFYEIASKVQILTFCTVMLAVRFLLYAALPEDRVNWVLPIEIIHGGINWALFWSAAVQYASDSAPPGSDARMQAAIGFLFYCIGPAIGGVLFGYLDEVEPYTNVFVGTAIGVLILQLLWNVFGWYFRGRRLSAERPSQALLGTADWPAAQ